MAPSIGVNLVRHLSISKGAIGAKAKIILAGHGSGSGILSKAAISHCDGGVAGVSALAFGGASIWKGIGLAGVGVGLFIVELAPVLVVAAGVVAAVGCVKYWRTQVGNAHARRTRQRTGR